MADAFVSLGENIAGIVTAAIDGEWGALAKSIVGTIGAVFGLGSSAAELS